MMVDCPLIKGSLALTFRALILSRHCGTRGIIRLQGIVSFTGCFARAALICLVAVVEVCSANTAGAQTPTASAGVRITGLIDLAFGPWNTIADMVLTNNVCIYNSVDTLYTITASGSSGALNLVSGALTLPYEVRFKKNGGAYSPALTHAVPSATIDGANTASQTCSGSTNATLQVTVTQASLASAKSGSYSGTLLLMVQPGV